MWLLHRAIEAGHFELPFQREISGLMLISGALVLVSGIFAFGLARTTVDPLNPEKASTLVVTGIYRWSRNPMYLGILVILCGWGVLLGSFFNLILLAGFVWFINNYQIKPEEQALLALFGDDFQAYMQQVRRWI